MHKRLVSPARFLIIALWIVLCLAPFHSLADTNLDAEIVEDGLITDESWEYVGYTYGGITFAIPRDSTPADLSAADRSRGIIFVIWNDDFTVQLRSFEPDVLTYDAFKTMISREETAEITARTVEGTEILRYRNTKPTGPDAELYGIITTGLDGKLYKISIFTGDSETFDTEAPVWKIAEIIYQTTRIQDFSEWGISD